jgi:hypothetical protein
VAEKPGRENGRDDSPPERWTRFAGTALFVVLALDLALIVVTGGGSFLTTQLKTSPWAFAAREVALAFALIVRFRLLAPFDRRLSAGKLLLALAVLPALFHLHFIGRRITGDALYYYVYTRSMIRDGDVDFANEYQHYGLLTRGDFSEPTDTGHRRSIYSVGPGLLWTPFFIAADGVAGVMKTAGLEVDTSGYGPLHLNAVALGSFAYGVLALFVIHALLRREFGDRLAAGAVLLLWWASFFEWYLTEQPLTSHPTSALLVALFFLLRQKGALQTTLGSFGVGLVLGVGMSVRWQNGVYLLLPAADLVIGAMRREPVVDLARRGGLMAAGVLMGIVPQMLAWKAIYGEYLLRYPPHGADFLRLDRPFLLNTLFSSRHGLLSWTPVFWCCFLGLIPLTRRNPRRFAILLIPVAVMTYVNACSGDWWSGGAFSNRRFDSLLPVFALGLAAFLQSASGFLKRHPAAPMAAIVLAAATWNLSFVRAVQQGEAPVALPTSLPDRVLASARAFSADIGFPTTWPASWIFAARYDASPGAFDLAAGKYLFYRQNNLGGVVNLGEAGDEAHILDGFSGRKQAGPIAYRAFSSQARLIVSLDLPETLELAFLARGGDVASNAEVLLNDESIGSVALGRDWETTRLTAPQSHWKRGPNVITLRAPSEVQLDRVTFQGNNR